MPCIPWQTHQPLSPFIRCITLPRCRDVFILLAVLTINVRHIIRSIATGRVYWLPFDCVFTSLIPSSSLEAVSPYRSWMRFIALYSEQKSILFSGVLNSLDEIESVEALLSSNTPVQCFWGAAAYYLSRTFHSLQLMNLTRLRDCKLAVFFLQLDFQPCWMLFLGLHHIK